MYFVYCIECKDGSIYTGITTNVERRLREHTNGDGGYYTRARKFKKLLYTEKHSDRSSALKRESAIKKLSREKKLRLFK